MDDVFTIHCSALPKDTRVVGFRGTEAISTLYAFEIYLSVQSEEGSEFDLATALSAKAKLVVDRDDGRPPFAFHGLFADLSLIHELGGRALLRAVLVPRMWHLTQTRHSRIFTSKSLVEILKASLEAGGLTSQDYTLKISQTYSPEEHVCQYQESHFDFISRWMEREGLYYYFEQGDDDEKLIISDNRSFQDALHPASIRFFPLVGTDTTAKECLQSFVARHRALPASVILKDYDYTKPTLDVSGNAPVSKTGLGEIHIHGRRFFSPDPGKRLAKLQAEEMLAREVVFTGSGTALYLRAGYTFELEDHPRSKAGDKYLATSVEHYANQAASTPELRRLTGLDTDDVYRVEVTAISHKVQFRAPLRTAWPRIYGTEHGLVDGEIDSEYAQIDDQGRYTVRFAFDESDLGAGKASTRVRMMQPHGGGIEGWHFPLRKGTEVLFTFLGGDPDRPVIAGVVPNALTPSPVTSGNHTKNVIQTGGRNRLEIEDKAGAERVTFSTPYADSYIRFGSPNEGHEMIIHTNENTLLNAGQDWDVSVGGHLDEHVVGPVKETYDAHKNELVAADVTETYCTSQLTKVGDSRRADYGSLKVYVHETTNETYQGAHVTQSWADRTVEVGGAHKETSHAGRTTTVTGGWTQTVNGASKMVSNGPVSWLKHDSHTSVTVGMTSDTFIGLKNSNFVGGQVSLTLGAMLSVKSAGELSITDGIRLSMTSGVDLKLALAVSLTMTPTAIKTINTKLAQSAAALETSGIFSFN